MTSNIKFKNLNNIKLKTLTALIFSLSMSMAHAKPEQCEELVEYSENQLSTDFTSFSKKITMPQESLKLLRKIQKETQVVSLKQATQNNQQQIFQLLSNVKTTNNSIAKLLRISPITGLALEDSGTAKKWFNFIIKNTEDNEVLDIIPKSNIEYYLLWESVDNVALGNAIKSLNKFIDTVLSQREKFKDSDTVIESLQEHLKNLDKELLNSQQKVTQPKSISVGINKFHSEIAKQCH